jgi:hypothetical protein
LFLELFYRHILQASHFFVKRIQEDFLQQDEAGFMDLIIVMEEILFSRFIPDEQIVFLLQNNFHAAE